jgi:VanZ family protein
VVVQLFVLYVPAVPGGDPPAYADKVVHLAVFAAGAWTGHRARIGSYALGVALVAHAVASELLQMTLLPGRSGDPLDVLADVVGVVVGLVVARHWPRATMDP